MSKQRTSRKSVEKILDVISDKSRKFELVVHQELGNRKNYWYSYSIVVKEPKYTDLTFIDGKLTVVKRNYATGWKYKETLLHTSSLKEAYDFAYKLLKASN